MNNFIVFEGICCSGKTTLCEMLNKKILDLNLNAVYNHGAMTYTDLGKEFKKVLGIKDHPITVSYFLTDLIINTQEVIKPLLKESNTILLQDRYYDAITTYISAYGKYSNNDYNIYDIPKALVDKGFFVKPSLKVFCIPPFEIIKERMEKSKVSPVHDFYRKNPKFHKLVYEELIEKSKENYSNKLIVDTSSNDSIKEGIDYILKFISSKND